MTTKLPRHVVGMQVFAIACAAIYVLCQRFGQFWSSSADVAHHYSLILRITQLVGLPIADDPTLGEMNFYPPGTHVMAAILGFFMHSPFAGMQLLSLLSLILAWGAIFFMLLTLPRKAATISSVALVLLLAINSKIFHLEILGQEIADSFFLSQILGYAVALIALAMLLYMEVANTPRWQRHVFALLAIYFTCFVHLMPAMQLMACYCLFLALDAFLQMRRRKIVRWRLVEALAIALLATAVVLKHPSFKAMKKISLNDGALALHIFNDATRIACFAIFVGLCSAAMLWYWVRQESQGNGQPIFKYVASLGLAMALLCLLQKILFSFGMGSLYAVKKYMFGLNTIAIIELALGAQLLWRTYLPRWSRESVVLRPIHLIVIPSLGIVLCGMLILPREAPFRTGNFIAKEQYFSQVVKTELPTLPKRYHYAAELANLPPISEYLFSIAWLQTPRSGNSLPPQLTPSTIKDFRDFGHIVTSDTSSLAKQFACRLKPDSGGMALLDGNCLRQALHMPIPNPDAEISFSEPKSSELCKWDGLGDAEHFGRWTTKRTVKLNCSVPALSSGKFKDVEIKLHGFLLPEGKRFLKIGVTGGSTKEVWFDLKDPERYVSLQLAPGTTQSFELNLEIPDAKTPKELGYGNDLRQLGVGVHRLILY